MKVHRLREWTFRLLTALLLAALILVVSLPAATLEVRAQQSEDGSCITDPDAYPWGDGFGWDDWCVGGDCPGTNGFAWGD